MGELDNNQAILGSKSNPDVNGIYQRDGKWVLDRRLSIEAIERRGLSPRIADLNLIGPDILPIPDYLLQELGLE